MKIVCFPKNFNNPYQEMLYAPMRAKGAAVAYIQSPSRSATLNLATYIPQLIFYRLAGYGIFHLHWVILLAPSSLPWRTSAGKKILYWHYRLFVRLIKLLGYKLVWTAHNALPLMGAFSNDKEARQFLAAAADLVVAHSPQTLEQLRSLGIRPKKSIMLPHSSYVDVYPNTASRENARAKLGIVGDSFVYLFLGHIQPYKGIVQLLDAYAQLQKEHTLLLIVGECTVPWLQRLIEKSAATGSVRLINGRAEDDMLQYYFAATDVVVLPFISITTSGSTLLALSFGKSVIVPSMGDLAHLPDSVSYKYDPADTRGVLTKMEEAYESRSSLIGKNTNALQYAKQFASSAIAEKLFRAFQELSKDL